MAESISLTQQIEDLDFYKAILQERNVTEQFQLDEYHMDVEDRITDASIKKQAIEVLNQLESQLEENEKLQAEEDVVEPEEEDDENVVMMSFLEEDEEITGRKGDEPDSSGSPQPEDVVEMPKFEMTEEEREAMNQLASFNQEQRLDIIESSVVSTPNEAALAAKQGLNNAKAGLQNAKSYVQGKIENMDADKMDEAWQSTFKGLKVAYDLAVKGIVAFYKIPAKRHYKKKLDYSLAESKGKDLLEIQKNEMKHHFFVDWLPKLILLLSALLIYNNFWKVGLIVLVVGFIYYMITDATFDYGGSRILNIISIFMDKDGVRIKDAYYNNMIVLYRYFDEYQSTMGVSVDEKAGIDIREDPDLGYILSFYVNEDKNVTISSLVDHKLNYYKVLPYLDTYNKSAKLQEKRQVSVMLDQILLMSINKDENLAELLASKEEYWDYFPELKELSQQRRLEAEALLEQEELEKVKKDLTIILAAKGINEKAMNIILMIISKKREWQFNVWNVSDKAVEGNENYLKIRCIFNQKGNLSTVNALKQQLESKFRSGILVKQLQDRGSFDLYVLFNAELSEEALIVEDLKVYNEKDEIYIGRSLTGKLTAKWNSAANHILVGGTSGSGKSVQILNLLTQLPMLKSYDYTTMFITSSSKIGDFVPFATKGALVSSGVEKQEQVFAYILELLTKREETFYAEGVDSIMKYNKKYPNKPMKQIVLVADEWENSRGTLDAKLAKRLEGLLVQILNIARSSGCIVIVGAQSILKGDIGTVVSKMFIKYSGSNDKPILRTIDPEIANYYGSLDKKPQGVFFYSSSNTPAQQESIFFGDTNYTLIQTPYLKEIGDETLDTKLPQLHGAEFANEIFSATPEDEPEVTTFNLNDDEIVENEESFQL